MNDENTKVNYSEIKPSENLDYFETFNKEIRAADRVLEERLKSRAGTKSARLTGGRTVKRDEEETELDDLNVTVRTDNFSKRSQKTCILSRMIEKAELNVIESHED